MQNQSIRVSEIQNPTDEELLTIKACDLGELGGLDSTKKDDYDDREHWFNDEV